MHCPKAQRVSPLKTIEEQDVMFEIKLEEQEIEKIKKQREMIMSIHKTMAKKDDEITRLKTLLEKYQPSYQVQAQLRIQLAEKESIMHGLISENQFLKKGFEEVIEECHQLTDKNRELQIERDKLVRQRLSIERVNREIEETFREYRLQCNEREQILLKDVSVYQSQVEELQKAIQEMKTHRKSVSDPEEVASLKAEIKKMEGEISERNAQLLKNRKLNHELSIQFDRSVNKIVEFEQELKQYRRDNHELKKTLGLVLEQEKYHKLRNKYMKGEQQNNVNIDEQSLEQEDSSDSNLDESSPQLSSIRY